MALQIDSITPSSVSLTEGQTQQLSVSVSGNILDITTYDVSPFVATVGAISATITSANSISVLSSGIGLNVVESTPLTVSGSKVYFSCKWDFNSSLADGSVFLRIGSVTYEVIHTRYTTPDVIKIQRNGVAIATHSGHTGVTSIDIVMDISNNLSTITCTPNVGSQFSAQSTLSNPISGSCRYGVYLSQSGKTSTLTGIVFKLYNNITYTLKDATDNTTIGTGTPVTYTADLADDGHNFQWTVTDGVSTVQSSLIPVSVSSAYTLIPLAGYKTTIKLAFEQKQMRNNDVYLYDYGSANDQYECEAEYLCDSMTWPIDRSSNVSRIVSQDGFYPFTPFIAVDQIGYDYPVFQGRADGWQGAWFMYKSKIVPDMSAGFSYVDQTYTPAGSTGFSIFGTSDFYVPEFNAKTETKYVYGISGSKFREYDTGESTVLRKAKIAWKSIPKNVLVFILKKLIIDTRSSIFTIGFGDTIRRLSPWNVLNGESDYGTFNVKLSSNEIVVEHAGGDLWNIEIEVMKWQ